jgi:hypothetical protein
MIRKNGATGLAGWMAAFWVGVCFFFNVNAFSGEAPAAPAMPPHWKVISDLPVPAAQVRAMSDRLGADLGGVRNTVYEVNGKRVQINVIVTPDSENAEKLMTRLKSMKTEAALLQKGLTVYEFVGQNDALPLIAEGRRHLEAR